MALARPAHLLYTELKTFQDKLAGFDIRKVYKTDKKSDGQYYSFTLDKDHESLYFRTHDWFGLLIRFSDRKDGIEDNTFMVMIFRWTQVNNLHSNPNSENEEDYYYAPRFILRRNDLKDAIHTFREIAKRTDIPPKRFWQYLENLPTNK